MPEIAEPTNSRSRRTRAALLDAAELLLERDGFDAVTMAAITQEAGVSRGAAYLHFGSRSDLIGALFDHIAARHDLVGSVEQVWDAPTGAEALDRWAHHIARYHPRLIAIDRAVERVRTSDPDADRHRHRVSASQLESCARLVRWLIADGHLHPVWTEEVAVDLLYGLISTDLIERLISDREWDEDRLADGLAQLLRQTFLHRPLA